MVPGSSEHKLITAKWVVKSKTHPTRKLKARLTARGFTQEHGVVDYAETFAPVSKMSSMQFYLCLVGMLDLHTHQLDIKSAFLNAKLEEITSLVETLQWSYKVNGFSKKFT